MFDMVSLSKTRVSAVILTLGILYILSFGVSMGMETDSHGDMAICPLTATSSLCRMSFSEHLNTWKNIFTAIPDSSALSLVVGLTVLAPSIVFKHLDTSQDQRPKSYRFYSYKHQISSIFDKLLELFSRGILNPKIYSLVTI